MARNQSPQRRLHWDPNLAAYSRNGALRSSKSPPRSRADGLAALRTTPSKRGAAPWHVELVATGIRAFADWWYDHRDIPREVVADAILDFVIAGAQRLGNPTSQP